MQTGVPLKEIPQSGHSSREKSFVNYLVWQRLCEAGIVVMQMSAARKVEDLRITKELIVINKLGIHARPAALFVKTANKFECDVFVEKDGEKVNGKSIMGLMMLAAGPGSKLIIYAEGHDAARAVVDIEALVRRKFDEE